MSIKRIASAFRFSEQDLNANREGKLSEGQRKMLRRRRNASLGLFLFALIAFIAFTASARNAMLCLDTFIALAVLQQLVRMARLQGDLGAERISATFGRIHLRVQNKKRSELFIEAAEGLRRFRITTEQMLALHDGQYYTIYAAARSETLLAIEPVDVTRTDEDKGRYEVDLGALAEDEAEVEKPKRDVFVLGDDGELEVRRESGSEGLHQITIRPES